MSFPHLTNTQGRQLDQIHLTGLALDCVIGIYPSERDRKQPIAVDLCFYLDTRRAARYATIADTINYADAVHVIADILEKNKFLLIETAAEAVCQHLLSTYKTSRGLPLLEAVVVRISKPTALPYPIIPAVQILRHPSDYIALHD